MTITRHKVSALVAVDHYETGATLYSSAWGEIAGPSVPGWSVTAPATVALVKPSGAGFAVYPEVTYTAGGGDFRRAQPVTPNAYWRTTVKVSKLTPPVPLTVRVICSDASGGDVTVSAPIDLTGATVVVDARAPASPSIRIELWNAANTARAVGKLRVVSVVVQALTRVQWLEMHPREARVTLDESWSPYVQAELVCPMPDQSALPDLDPRTKRRVRLTLAQSGQTSKLVKDATTLWAGRKVSYLTSTYAGQKVSAFTDLFGDPLNDSDRPDLAYTRTVDLHLRERAIDYVTATMRLTLMSDEGLAQDFGRINTTDPALIPPATTDLRTLVAWALNLIGGVLDGAATTAPIVAADVVWSLGQSVWDFLDPFVVAAGLRLRCDEARVWHLEAPPTGAAGAVTIGAVTALDDTLSREGWGDSLVLANSWTDPATDADTTSYAAATAVAGVTAYTRTVLVNKTAKAKATAAAASALLARYLTRGRVVAVRAVNDYRVTPGQTATFTTVATTIAPLLVSAVTWEWPDDEMTVTTRDLPA